MKDFGHAELDPTQPKMGADAVAANIAGQTGGKVDMVFFGGEFGPTGGATFLADALKAHGVNTIFMGGDGIYDPNFISQSSNGGVLTAYASKGGPDVATSKTASAFVAIEKKTIAIRSATAGPSAGLRANTTPALFVFSESPSLVSVVAIPPSLQ